MTLNLTEDLFVTAITKYFKEHQAPYSLKQLFLLYPELHIRELNPKSKWIARWDDAKKLEQIKDEDMVDDEPDWRDVIQQEQEDEHPAPAPAPIGGIKRPVITSSSTSRKSKTCRLSGDPFVKNGGDRSCLLTRDDHLTVERNGTTFDLSAEFMNLREETFTMIDKKDKLSEVHILSTNYIYYLEDSVMKSTTQYAGGQQAHVALKELVNIRDGYQFVPSDVYTWLVEIQGAIKLNTSLTDMKRMGIRYLNQSSNAEYDQKWQAADLIYALIPKMFFWKSDCDVEDTFVKLYLSNLIEVVFLPFFIDNDLTYGWANKCMSSISLKPDFSVSVLPECDLSFELVVLEAKPPGKNKNSNDFLKLAVQLKNMVDSLISYCVSDPVVVGILVDFFDCHVYSMKLIKEGVYLMVKRSSFHLPRDCSYVTCLTSGLESLNQAKSLLSPTIAAIHARDGNVADIEMIRTSFCWYKSKSTTTDTPAATNSGSE